MTDTATAPLMTSVLALSLDLSGRQTIKRVHVEYENPEYGALISVDDRPVAFLADIDADPALQIELSGLLSRVAKERGVVVSCDYDGNS